MKHEWLDRTALRLPRLLLCTTEKQYLSAAKGLGVASPFPFLSPGAIATNHTFENTGSGIVCIVCMLIDKKRPMALTAALLAHEAVHIKQELMKNIGEETPGAEIEAYAVQNAVLELLGSYIKQAKKS